MPEKNIQVGQEWLMANDEVTTIVKSLCNGFWEDRRGFLYNQAGICCGAKERTLVRLHPGASVGDINSTVKGSGARFNAGKPPYDLVPLMAMADYYAMTNGDATDGYDGALAELGLFQARDEELKDDSTHLMYALMAVGDGWEECARVFEYGRKKYAAWNWAKGMAWSVPLACAIRHLTAMLRLEELDPESGLSHRGHYYCNIAMLYTFLDTYPEGDDRPAAGMLIMNPEADASVDVGPDFLKPSESTMQNVDAMIKLLQAIRS